MKLNVIDLIGYLGWTIIAIITLYLFLRIFGFIHSTSLEEILIGVVISYAMIIGRHETKISYMEKHMNSIESKIDILLKRRK